MDNEKLYGKRYRHLKTGGLYEIVGAGQIEKTLEDVIIYQNVETGRMWVRPTKEFFDGRFEEV